MRNSLLLFLALLLLTVAGAVGIRVATQRHLEEMQKESLSDTELQQLIADQQRLTSMNLFPHGGSRDAGEILNRFVRLDSGTPEERAPEQAAPWEEPSVQNALSCKPPGTFPECIQEIPPVDTSILSALMPYDTWDPSSSGAWHRYLAGPHVESGVEAPIPNFVGLQVLAKLRLLQGLSSGNVMPALQEVRQLARLSYSSQILVGEMVAVAILGLERSTYEAALSKGIIANDAWLPVSKEDTTALRRVAFGMATLFSSPYPKASLQPLKATVPAPLSECSGLAEAMAVGRMPRKIFGKPWPGEIHLSEPTEVMEAGMGSCRPYYLGPLWKDSSRDLDLLEEDKGMELAFSIPFVRQYLTLQFMKVGQWNLYRNASP